jgi:arabinogalactan oligomer/maltooligosaccharide transport system substrate-binding protein
MRYLGWFLAGLFLLAACTQGNPQDGANRARAYPSQAAVIGTATTPESSIPAPNGTINLWQSWSEGETSLLVQIIAEFQAENPGIQFDVRYVPAENFQERLKADLAQGNGPTLWFGPADWGPSLYNGGFVADLSDQVGIGLVQTLNRAGVDSVRYKQALIGLPYSIRGVVLYRNRQLIPTAPATLDELVSLAQTATKGDIAGADLERSFQFSGAHLEGIGGKLMDETGAPAFENAAGVAWIDLLRSFARAGPTEFLSDQDIERFKANQAGFIIDGTWNMKALAQAIGAQNLAIDPWPAYRDGHLSGFVQSDILYMSSQARGAEQDAALAFMGYFLSPRVQARLTQIDHIPAVGSKYIIDPLMAQAITALTGGIAYPTFPQMAVYTAQMDVALKSIFEDGADPASALEAAAVAIRAAQANSQAFSTKPATIPIP